MKYGAMNFPIKPLFDELEKIAGLGFDYLELTIDPPCAHYSEVEKIKKPLLDILARKGMDVVCHLPTFVYTADLSPDIRRASVREMLCALEAASRINAQKAVLHPSFISGLGPFVMETANKYADESLSIILEKAGRLNIQLCFENMFPKYHNSFSPDHFSTLFKKYPRLKMTLDTGHANIDDPKQTRLFEFIRLFPDRIGHIHISDNNGKKDEHLKVGKGNIDFVKFTEHIKSSGYDDTMTFEIFSPDPDDLVESREIISSRL